MKINWKQKFSSRKFWALLVALTVSAATALGADSGMIEHLTGVIGSIGACVVYILAEAIVDSNRDGE